MAGGTVDLARWGVGKIKVPPTDFRVALVEEYRFVCNEFFKKKGEGGKKERRGEEKESREKEKQNPLQEGEMETQGYLIFFLLSVDPFPFFFLVYLHLYFKLSAPLPFCFVVVSLMSCLYGTVCLLFFQPFLLL